MSYALAVKTMALSVEVPKPKQQNPDSSGTNYNNIEKNIEKAFNIWNHDFENDSDFDSPTKSDNTMQVGLMPMPVMWGPVIPFEPGYHIFDQNQQIYDLEQENLFLLHRALDIEPRLQLLNREFLCVNLRERNYEEIQIQLEIAIQKYESYFGIYEQNQVEHFIQTQTNPHKFHLHDQIQIQNQIQNQHQFQAQTQIENSIQIQTQNQTQNQTENQTQNQTQNQTENQTQNQIQNQTQNQAQNQTQNQTQNPIHVQFHNKVQIQHHRELEQQMIQQHMTEHENLKLENVKHEIAKEKTVETGAEIKKNEAFRKKIKSKSERVLLTINPEYDIFEKLTILDNPITLFDEFIGNNFRFYPRNNGIDDLQNKIYITENFENNKMNDHGLNKSQFKKIGDGGKTRKRYSAKEMIEIYRKNQKNVHRFLEERTLKKLSIMKEIKSSFLWHVFPEKLTEYIQLKKDCERVFKFKMVCASNDIENGFKENLRQRRQVLKDIVRKHNDEGVPDGCEEVEELTENSGSEESLESGVHFKCRGHEMCEKDKNEKDKNTN